MSHVEIALDYCQQVVNGHVSTCVYTQQACQRQLDDLERANADPGWGYYFSDWHGNEICDFVEGFNHIEGEWETDNLVLRPFQSWWLSTIFGWRRTNDHGLRFNTVYIEVSRKQGKTFLTAPVGLHRLSRFKVWDAKSGKWKLERGPKVLIAATTGDQARLLFEAAQLIARDMPGYTQDDQVEVFANSIVCRANNGSMKPINAKASTQDGKNGSMITIDELHAHKDRRLFDVLKSGRGARKNPLSWYITTAGYDDTGVCYEQREYLVKILSKLLPGDHYFGVIYTLDDDDDVFDESVWCKANPNLGVSVQLDELRTYAEEARNSPQSLLEFETKRMNRWCSAAASYFNVEHWRQCANPNLKIEDFYGSPCWAGMDLALKSDFCSLAFVFYDGDMWTIFNRHYLPMATIRNPSNPHFAAYSIWANEGWIKACDPVFKPGSEPNEHEINFWQIGEEAAGIIDSIGSVSELDYDRAYGTQVSQDIADRTGIIRVDMPMGSWQTFSAAMFELKTAMQAGRVQHNGDPVMTWMISNVTAKEDRRGNVYPRKDRYDLKIDGPVAALMPIGRALVSEPPAEPITPERRAELAEKGIVLL